MNASAAHARAWTTSNPDAHPPAAFAGRPTYQGAANLGDILWFCSVDMNHIYYVSPECQRLTARGRDEIHKNPRLLLAAIHPEDRGRVLAFLERRPEHREQEFYRIITSSGSTRSVRHTIFAIQGGARSIGSLGVAEDVTVLGELQEQLRQSQKIDSLGQLSLGVIHDLNNLLGLIGGYCELAGKTPDPAKRTEYLEGITQTVGSAARLTNRVLDFVRGRTAGGALLDLNDWLARMRDLLEVMVGAGIPLELKFGSNLPKVLVDQSGLEQLLFNLVLNAREALSDGGTLTIQTDVIFVTAEPHHFGKSVRPGTYVLLRVIDTGRGMDSGTLQRAFDPLFTTKPPGKGSGLGLSVAYVFVKQNGGEILIDSEQGRGTSVSVLLPCEAVGE